MSALPQPAEQWVIVEPERIDLVWEHVAPGIARALETANGEATVEDTRIGLRAGRTRLMMLWTEGATLGVVFQMLEFPRYRIARVLLLFGENMRLLRDGMRAAERWAKDQGCKYVEGWVASASRERLFSLFGYKRAYSILRKGLT